jgi:hypothetical protein
MRNFSCRYFKYALGLFMLMFALSLSQATIGVVEAKITNETIILNEETIAMDKANPQIQAVMAIQNRHTPLLMSLPDVVGTATGLTDDGRPAIMVFTRYKVGAGVIPEILDGVPVVVKVTGEFSSMKNLAAIEKKGKTTVDPTARFDRPVPIGVSTGNKGECSAGTIGARVKDGKNVYALSNNHVYALENSAPIGSNVLQPGLYDTRCIFYSGNIIGQLDDYEPINFGSLINHIDAAIALSSKDLLGRATPANGYGTPKSATVPARVGQAVQKYGRTTSLTKGIITGINATVSVTYSSRTARFDDQIVVSSGKAIYKSR